MQPLRIVIDVRHIKDFGIGTYIRNLVEALGELDHGESVSARRPTTPMFPICRRLPDNFETVVYHEPQRSHTGTTSRIRGSLKSFAPDLVHLPLNDVPLLMRNPYVVTIHDMSSFLFDGRTGSAREPPALPLPPRTCCAPTA